MAEYIDREDLKKLILEEIEFCGEPNASFRPIGYGVVLGLRSVLGYTTVLPAVNVPEIVRCKDCKHSTLMYGTYVCNNTQSPWFNDEFDINLEANDFVVTVKRKDVQTMAELKPCPFCGSIPFLCVNKYRHDQFTYSVKCSNSACDVIPLTYECSEETQAISDWNKRADADDVKHGEWQEIDNLVIEHGLPTVKGKTWRCSICGEARKKRTAPDMNYCPNCGAKMDLKEGAEE